MKNIAVFFGGRSAEHDVSIITGLQFIENMDKSKYKPIPVFISSEGFWYTGDKLFDPAFYKKFDEKQVEKVFFNPSAGNKSLSKAGFFGIKEVASFEAAVIAMHGMHGEDGTLQGLFELADMPYTSANVTGSAVCMDKVVMKAACIGFNVPVLPGVDFLREEYAADKEAVLAEVKRVCGFPVIVKPANLGSSIGVSCAEDEAEFEKAVALAASYDRKILIERYIRNLKEVNCAVVGEGTDVMTGVVEEPVGSGKLLSFEDKYLDNGKGGKSQGMKSLSRKIPADIPAETDEEVKRISKHIFKKLGLKGVVRIDYMIDMDDNTLYLNEINSIPGSFAFYLYEPIGIPYAKLIDRLIEGAFAAMEEKKHNSFAFDSKILDKAQKGQLGGAKK